jgi:hypothetical protein
VSWGVLVLLWPLFHYDRWRDAWILRLVGEQHGPVLVAPARPASQAPQRPAPHRAARQSRSTAPLLMLGLGSAVIAAGLGFAVARSAGGGTSRAVGAGPVSSGLLEVSLPPGWHRQAAAAAPLALSDELSLGAATEDGATLLVGRSGNPDPATVAAEVLQSLPRASGPEAVTLGGAQFVRYVFDQPPSQTAEARAAYVLATTVGTVVGVCRGDGSSDLPIAGCERILASLTVRAGAPAPSLPNNYVTSLTLTVHDLNAVRTSLGLELERASGARQQAVVADKLAAAHAQAADALARLQAGPATAANAAVAAALRQTSSSYRSLALAATHGNAQRYADAKAALQRDGAGLQSAFQQLAAFGYQLAPAA